MSQQVGFQEIELVDIVHFFVERWRPLLSVVVIVSTLVFCGLLTKIIVFQKASSIESVEIVDTSIKKKRYKAVAFIELPQILSSSGQLVFLVTPNFLISLYSNDQIKLSSISPVPGEIQSNGLWLKAEGDSQDVVEELVKNTVKELTLYVNEKEGEAKQNKNKRYVVIGSTRMAKYELVDLSKSVSAQLTEEKAVEEVFTMRAMLKVAILSLFIGMFVSLLYAGFCKIVLDYRKKYSST